MTSHRYNMQLEFDDLVGKIEAIRDELMNHSNQNPKERVQLNIGALTDRMHYQVHRVIEIFDLSQTPGGDLKFDIEHEDWSRFDEG